MRLSHTTNAQDIALTEADEWARQNQAAHGIIRGVLSVAEDLDTQLSDMSQRICGLEDEISRKNCEIEDLQTQLDEAP